MKIKRWKIAIAIVIVGLFFTGTAHIGLSTSIQKTETVPHTTGTQSSFDPFMQGWTYRKQITIDHSKVTSDLTNFPVFISITDSDLHAKAQTNGNDILFMDDIGVAQQLNHEIESYDGSTGSLVAWVNMPSISSTVDIVLYMYYGNPNCDSQQHVEATWNSNFMAVWHLQSDPTQPTHDSTQNHNDGSAHGTMDASNVVNGKVGKCLVFDGADDYISVPDSPSLDPTDLTLVAWYQPKDENQISGDFLVKEGYDYWGNADGRIYGFWIHQEENYFGGEFETNTYQQQDLIGNQPMSVGIWSYLALTFHKATQEGIFYVNGSINGIMNPCDSSVLWYHNPWDFVMGANRFASGGSHVIDIFYHCDLDEIRILSTPLSSGWISTEYNNENAPSSFYSIGSEVPIQPPAKPQRPSGTINGKPGTEYTYTTVTTDPYSNTLYYTWSWGDGNVSGWYGPYGSGVVASASHVWATKGSYEIKVKAKDQRGLESNWSDPLSVTMPLIYDYHGPSFLDRLFERFPNAFPILRRLLGY